MLLDAGAQFWIHVLDRADPDTHHPGAQVAEVLPGQRIRPQWRGPRRLLVVLFDRLTRRGRARWLQWHRRRSHHGLLVPRGDQFTIMLTTRVVYDFGARRARRYRVSIRPSQPRDQVVYR